MDADDIKLLSDNDVAALLVEYEQELVRVHEIISEIRNMSGARFTRELVSRLEMSNLQDVRVRYKIAAVRGVPQVLDALCEEGAERALEVDGHGHGALPEIQVGREGGIHCVLQRLVGRAVGHAQVLCEGAAENKRR